MSISLKIVVVGDGAVGKTCLLWCYAKDEVPPEYVPTVFDNYVVRVDVDNREVNLQLWDTAGQEELENIRVLSYTSTDVFLLCFAVSEPSSFENIKSKWIPELRKYVNKPVVVLVGTKSDLKYDEAVIQRLACRYQKPITKEQGDRKAKEIGAVGYIECSAIRKTGIKEVFDFAMMTALKPSKSLFGSKTRFDPRIEAKLQIENNSRFAPKSQFENESRFVFWSQFENESRFVFMSQFENNSRFAPKPQFENESRFAPNSQFENNSRFAPKPQLKAKHQSEIDILSIYLCLFVVNAVLILVIYKLWL